MRRLFRFVTRVVYTHDKVRFFEARNGWSKLGFALPLTSFKQKHSFFTEGLCLSKIIMLVRTDQPNFGNNELRGTTATELQCIVRV